MHKDVTFSAESQQCKHSTRFPTVHSGGQYLCEWQISRCLIWTEFLSDSTLGGDLGNQRAPIHTLSHPTLRCLSLTLPSSLYTYLTISKLGIRNSNHFNCCSTYREITANFVFTGGCQKATAFTAKLLLFYVPLSHSGFVSSLCNLLSRGEAYKFPVHAPSSFCPWKLRLARSELGLLGIDTGAAKSAPGSVGSNEMALTW